MIASFAVVIAASNSFSCTSLSARIVDWAVLKSESRSLIADIIELRFIVANVGVVDRVLLSIPGGIASNACFWAQLNSIAWLSFSIKSMLPVWSAEVLVPGKVAVPIKLAIAEPLSTIEMFAKSESGSNPMLSKSDAK